MNCVRFSGHYIFQKNAFQPKLNNLIKFTLGHWYTHVYKLPAKIGVEFVEIKHLKIW